LSYQSRLAGHNGSMLGLYPRMRVRHAGLRWVDEAVWPRTLRDLLAVTIGMTVGPAVRAIRLYRPDPGRTNLA
jgi:hypothetical protein